MDKARKQAGCLHHKEREFLNIARAEFRAKVRKRVKVGWPPYERSAQTDKQARLWNLAIDLWGDQAK